MHNRFFSAAASARYAEIVEPIAAQAFGALRGRDRAELIEDPISWYPMKVFLELLARVADEPGAGRPGHAESSGGPQRQPVSLLLGGFETTIQMLSAAIASLLLNPEALQRVQADPSLMDAAIDEAFRWPSPSAGLYRLVLRETEIAGDHGRGGQHGTDALPVSIGAD